MARENKVTWVDCRVLNKHATELITAISEYAIDGFENSKLHNDFFIYEALAKLRTRMEKIFETT